MSRSKLTRLTVGATPYDAAGAPAQTLFFSEFDPGNGQEPIDLGEDMGGFGNLTHPMDLSRNNVKRVAPTGRFKPSQDEWEVFLQMILNTAGTEAGGTTTFTPGSASQVRFLEYTDATTRIHRLLNCVVATAEISGQAGQEVGLSVQWQGSDWTNPGGPTTYPGLPLGTRFLFGDLALSVNGVSTPCQNFSLRLDHAVSNDRFFFGFTSTPLNLDRKVRLSLNIPYGIAAAAWGAGAVDGGVPVVFTFNATQYGVASRMVITLPAVRYKQPPASVRVPSEAFVQIQDAMCMAPTVAGALQPEITVALTPIVA